MQVFLSVYFSTSGRTNINGFPSGQLVLRACSETSPSLRKSLMNSVLFLLTAARKFETS